MFQFAIHSARLLFEGKLFADPGWVLRQGLVVTAGVLAVFFVLGAIGVPLLANVIVTSLAGGFVTPFLFKDLRAAP